MARTQKQGRQRQKSVFASISNGSSGFSKWFKRCNTRNWIKTDFFVWQSDQVNSKLYDYDCLTHQAKISQIVNWLKTKWKHIYIRNTTKRFKYLQIYSSLVAVSKPNQCNVVCFTIFFYFYLNVYGWKYKKKKQSIKRKH